VTDAENPPTEPNPPAEADTPAEPTGESAAATPAPTPAAAAPAPAPVETTPPAETVAPADDVAVTAPAHVGVPAQAEVQPAAVVTPPAKGAYWGTGRRKSAVARVRLLAGDGTIKINKRAVDDYFTEPQERAAVAEPLKVTNTVGHWNVFVNVHGGGHTGQAGAILLGVARALVKADGRHEAALREAGYLTRDSRRVERKKYGQRKARRRFQFSKR